MNKVDSSKLALCRHGRLGLVNGVKLVGTNTKEAHTLHYGYRVDGSLWHSKDARFINEIDAKLILEMLGPTAFTKSYKAA